MIKELLSHTCSEKLPRFCDTKTEHSSFLRRQETIHLIIKEITPNSIGDGNGETKKNQL